MNSSNLTTTLSAEYSATTPTISPGTTTQPNTLAYAMYDFSVFFNNYLDPSLSTTGSILNLACCLIFSTSSKFDNRMYRLLFWVALFHMATHTVEAFFVLAASHHLWISHSYSMTFYLHIFKEPIKNMLIMMSWLCSISVSWERYILISQTRLFDRFTKVPIWALITTFAIASIGAFTFQIIGYQIIGYYVYMCNEQLCYFYTNKNESYVLYGNYDIRMENQGKINEYFAKVHSQVSDTTPYQIGALGVFAFRDILLWSVFLVINVLLAYETTKHVRKTHALSRIKPDVDWRMMEARTTAVAGAGEPAVPRTPETSGPVMSAAQRAQIRVTLMVIVTSSIMALSGFFYFINMVLKSKYLQKAESNSAVLNGLFLVLELGLSDTFYFFSYWVDFFVYLGFDTNFRGRIIELFKRGASVFKRQ
jgi:hypothetical protein